VSFVDTKQAFETRYQTQILAARPGLPIHFENAPFSQPATSEWTRIVINEAKVRGITIGGPTRRAIRYGGLCVVAIFVPEWSDSVLVAAIADDISDVFINARFSLGSSGTIKCMTPRLIPVGRGIDGFWQSQVHVDYERTRIA
jgi:hypothetical protein